MKALIIIIFLFLLFISGCAVVQPWERERLADPNMIFDENPIEKGIKDHYINIREGSEGGNGSQSGGCGCG
ncbi:MAG: DUF4266 domain-containing protein [Bacteroidetes bacterium]|nr:DUF4266 domain-containing protein [Bacteroidota bacterium]